MDTEAEANQAMDYRMMEDGDGRDQNHALSVANQTNASRITSLR